ncbi:ABC transporter ATP-binding protein [Ktedonobacter sp. SOSP1-85]|uniref:ABC transporter ATP-binding protein n=1 Tax=Ktedonobacter sp. SOSP1-85 TaxID=2778367 RepID=UPI001914FFC8|nr:ABC transporter ATP-binding protein [Ktedonobacter sp. SOSP1-85]GHO80618.1 ABC transporter ATP-binding protein [Ktedonobacter sp. SOSP1-85]
MTQETLVPIDTGHIPHATETPIISVENLVKRYKKATKNAVDQISFSVAPGTLFALLGPNGSGKTTTISTLTTTLAPTSGTIRIAGYDLATQAHLIRSQIGIIFQKPSLDLNLTAEENIRLHATLYGLYPYRPLFRLMPKTYRAQVQELAHLLGIEESLFKPVKTFSGGMKRKLEIVRSLLHRPEVLFLDEPTTGLDPESRRELWDHLRQVRAESGTTIFLTTHYLEEAEGADNILIINRGQIVSAGSPQQIKTSLTQPMLFIDAHEREQLRVELRAKNIDFKEDGHFSIALENQQVHQLLKSIDTPLSMVQTHTPSLEDAYIHIIKQEYIEEQTEGHTK